MGVRLIFHKFLNDRVYQGLIYGLTPLLIEYVLKNVRVVARRTINDTQNIETNI